MFKIELVSLPARFPVSDPKDGINRFSFTMSSKNPELILDFRFE